MYKITPVLQFASITNHQHRVWYNASELSNAHIRNTEVIRTPVLPFSNLGQAGFQAKPHLDGSLGTCFPRDLYDLDLSDVFTWVGTV